MVLSGEHPALSRIRLALIAVGATGTILALTGLLAHQLFRQPTTLKYIVSVLAPATLVVLAASRRPLHLMVGALIALAPFGSLSTSFSGIATPLAAVLIGAAVVVAVIDSPLRRGVSPMAIAGIVVALLLAEPILAGSDVLYNVLWLASILTVAWLVALVASEPGGMPVICGALAAGVAIQAGLAIYEFHTGRLLNFYGAAGSQAFGQNYFFTYGVQNRPVGSFNDPITLGNVLALALPLLITLAHVVRNLTLRLVVIVVGGATGVALVLSLSRGSWIGAAVGVAVTVMLLPRGARRTSIVVVAALVAAAVAIGGASTGQNLSKRAQSILHPTASTSITAAEDIERRNLWGAALSVFRDHPVAGVGLNNVDPLLAQRTAGVTPFAHAHSTYFQALAEAGVLGGVAILVAWLAAGTAIVSRLRRTERHESQLLAAGLAGSALAILVEWVTDYTVRQISVAIFVATIFGLASSLIDPSRARHATP